MEVVTRQISGLGNQLFQYAAGVFYAAQLGASLRLAIDSPQNQVSHGYARPFLLSRFNLSIPMLPITTAERALFSTKPQARVIAALQRAMGTQLITETAAQRHHFLPTLPVARGTRRLFLFGYWQTWHIPAAHEARLRRDLTFRNAPEGRNAEMLGRIASTSDAVSLHVRRGDYTTVAEGNKNLPLDYYLAAVRHFQERLRKPTFFVFSDDIAWCRENLPAGMRLVFVDHNDDLTSHEDLRLMSACRHHILANSSFSWWGAWLNAREDRMVFAPRYWMLTPDSDYPDLLPPDWTRRPATSG